MEDQHIDFNWVTQHKLRIDQSLAVNSFEREYRDYYAHLKHIENAVCETMAYNFLTECVANQDLGLDSKEALPWDIYKQALNKVIMWCKEWRDKKEELKG